MYQYTLSLYEKAMPDEMELEQKLLAAKQCGYNSIELCIDQHPQRAARLDWNSQQIKKLVCFLIDHDLHITTLSLSLLRSCPIGMLDEGMNQKAVELVTKGVDLCCKLGAQVMLINGYDVYETQSTPQTVERFKTNLPKIVEIAAKRGVIIAIENAEMPFVDSIAKAARLVEEVNSPYFCIYADVGNSCNAMQADSAMVAQDILTGQGKIAAVHLKDSLPNQFRFVKYGCGNMDFASAITQLKSQGVHIFTAELFYEPENDWKAEAIRVNNFLRNFFD